jgi:hypothetical protein
MGAKVIYCGHDGCFVADIFLVAGANIVRANGEVKINELLPIERATHQLTDFPSGGFWRRDLGVFVVPRKQVTEVKK